MKFRLRFVKFSLILSVFVILVWIFKSSSEISHQKSKKCRDWHDYSFLKVEKLRIGPGEQGRPFKLTNSIEIAENEKLFNTTGVSVIVSDKISVNRSIPDWRDAECQGVSYPSQLPSVSVIIIFYNEVKSVLLRTIHSVVNRTPRELLKEIILVNDKSSNQELYEPLKKYVSENFGSLVKILNLKERKGLIVTRLEGAAIATGEILVFFDSHIEVNTNWLPPLITPIKFNRRLATVPTIDDFSSETFEHFPTQPYRGGIDWKLIYRRFQRYLPENSSKIAPFPNPIMLGCAFAIDRKFFMEELDGYDREFKIWNAENYELSFKLWLCADGLFEVPCSRVTHTFRMINPSRSSIKEDFLARNFKRLAEVWLDKYKQAVYDREPDRYKKVNVGDLSHVKAIRERLKCKPFKYFLTAIAPEMLTRYPVEKNPPVFASGQIKSLLHADTCIDIAPGDGLYNSIGIYYCSEVDEKGFPEKSQFFRLTLFKNINFGFEEFCVDAFKLLVPDCHYSEFGNQIWRYDYRKNLIINKNEEEKEFCITGDFPKQALSLEICDEKNENQKWKFSNENRKLLDKWDEIYGYEKMVYKKGGYRKDKMAPMREEGLWRCEEGEKN